MPVIDKKTTWLKSWKTEDGQEHFQIVKGVYLYTCSKCRQVVGDKDLDKIKEFAAVHDRTHNDSNVTVSTIVTD